MSANPFADAFDNVPSFIDDDDWGLNGVLDEQPQVDCDVLENARAGKLSTARSAFFVEQHDPIPPEAPPVQYEQPEPEWADRVGSDGLTPSTRPLPDWCTPPDPCPETEANLMTQYANLMTQYGAIAAKVDNGERILLADLHNAYILTHLSEALNGYRISNTEKLSAIPLMKSELEQLERDTGILYSRLERVDGISRESWAKHRGLREKMKWWAFHVSGESYRSSYHSHKGSLMYKNYIAYTTIAIDYDDKANPLVMLYLLDDMVLGFERDDDDGVYRFRSSIHPTNGAVLDWVQWTGSDEFRAAAERLTNKLKHYALKKHKDTVDSTAFHKFVYLNTTGVNAHRLMCTDAICKAVTLP